MNVERMQQVAPLFEVFGLAESLRLVRDLLDIVSDHGLAAGAINDMTTLAVAMVQRDPSITRGRIVETLRRCIRRYRVAAFREAGMDDGEAEAAINATPALQAMTQAYPDVRRVRADLTRLIESAQAHA